ncbi:poly(A)-specific ribonuclease [Phlyctochytrium planicorne]|nr:poly(A)-specific ribonuclease [Phlyctochytrium planicorne]
MSEVAFSCLLRKRQFKKRKTWEHDGILIISSTGTLLFDQEGKQLAKSATPKKIEEGTGTFLGEWEIEVSGEIKWADYLSGKCFNQGTVEIANVRGKENNNPTSKFKKPLGNAQNSVPAKKLKESPPDAIKLTNPPQAQAKSFCREVFIDPLGDERVKVLCCENPSDVTTFDAGKAYSILICGYERLRTVASKIEKASIDLFIADEGHRLKNSDIQAFKVLAGLKTKKRIILSGTPIQNDLMELFAMCNLVNPGILGTPASFSKVFEVPILKSKEQNATEEEIEIGLERSKELFRLHQLFILRRTSDSIKAYLPPKTEFTIFLRLSSIQQSIYKEIAAFYTKRLSKEDEASLRKKALALIAVLKKLTNSAELIQSDAGELIEELGLKEMIERRPSTEDLLSSKLTVLKQLLSQIRESTDEKVVIVSNYTQTLDLVQAMITDKGWDFLRLDGKTNVKLRQDIVTKYNSSDHPAFCMLLSAKAGGEGITLIGASRLVLLDINWNPAVCKQAQARIWRDGQKKPVFIYRFLTQGTIEEKIFQRQLFKNNIGDDVFNESVEHEQFEFKELHDLFTFHVDGKPSFIEETTSNFDMLAEADAKILDPSLHYALHEHSPYPLKIIINDIVDAAPITSLCFDGQEELLWSGTETGRLVSSCVSPMSLDRYTSFKSHRGPVRQILTDETGIFSIGGNSVRHSSRRGLYKWEFKRDLNMELHCMSFMHSKSELVIAGQSKYFALMNIIRGTVIREIEVEYDIVLMRKSRMLACGSTCGRVLLMDPRNLRMEHSIQAHSGTISDMDISGNTLVTCGFSVRGEHMIIEPMIKLYDIRTMKSLPPIPFPNGPYFLKFHPLLKSTLFTSSQTGHLQICDIESPSSNVQFFQLDIQNYMTSADVSGTGEIMAFGANVGNVQQWIEKDTSKVNNFSKNTEFPDAVITPMNLEVNDETPLSIVGLPYFDRPLMSVLPPGIISVNGKPPPRIPPEILSQVKMMDFVGYAQNPGTFRRNQAVNIQSYGKGVDEPKFRSEQERESLTARIRSLSGNDVDMSIPAENPDASSNQGYNFGSFSAPKFYRRVEIKYSKFGIEDFDFRFYNRTSYGGLETDIANSYCNAMLQMLFYCEPISKLAKYHIKTDCPKEFCLSCELGFLFRMLEDSQGANCQATNFLRAFSNIPQANALGLFDTDSFNRQISYGPLIQSFNRFILEQMHQEIGTVPSLRIQQGLGDEETTPSLMQQVIGLRLQNVNRCQCQHEVLREVRPFVVDLTYTKATVPGKPSASPRKDQRFCSILHQSINRDAYSKSLCPSCNKYQFTTHHKFLKTPPNVLSVNVNMPVEDSVSYFGEGGKSWIPSRIAIKIEEEDLSIEDASSENAELDSSIIYELRCSIAEIRLDHDKPHLVCFAKPSSEERWHIFNDFLVEPVLDTEPAFCTRWKIPSVLTYVRVDVDEQLDFPQLEREQHQADILLHTTLLNRRKDLSIQFRPLTKEEIPVEPGMLCAIDAEFVALNKEELDIRSDGTRSVLKPSRLGLARVSVIRGTGESEGLPFIDDYINSSEPIVDYLTEFSGIKAGDLDPVISSKPLVPLKTAYKKLRLLVDMGCVFIGHGLKKDFRIINILIPQNQVIDTVDIFWIKERQRKLSLRFLSWSLLRSDIQKDTHDSVEDARTALLLYKKYLEFSEQGVFEDVLERIYEEGRAYNFRPPAATPY